MSPTSPPQPASKPQPGADALFSLPLFDSLSEEQRAAVFNDNPRLVVLAGAGAGKTRVLVARLARLLWGAEPIPPERILAISFTRKACQEIRERLEGVKRELGGASGRLPTVDTFHATALKIVRDGLRPTPRILDEGPESGAYFARFISQDAWLRGRGIPRERLEEALSKRDCGVLTRAQTAAFRARYRRFKRAAGVMALDDLVPLALELLREPRFLRRWQKRFDVLLVDEFQDVDDGQMALFEALTGGGAAWCLFGDDDQAIYRWRGSNPECLRQLARRDDVDVAMLPTNYRSRPPILDLAREVVEGDVARLEKPVIPARAGGALPRVRVADDDGASLVAEIRAQLKAGHSAKDVCILVRDHVDGRRALRLLEKAGIPAIPAAVQGRADPTAVIVQTYHGSKGLEYPIVVMPFLDKGRFPNTRRLKRDKANLMSELEEVREAHRALAALRAARRRRLTRLWWVLISAYHPPHSRPRPRGWMARLAYEAFMAAEGLWRLVWSGDIHRSLALREKRARAYDAQIRALVPKASRREALEEAASAWGDEARQTLAEERRLCYVAITRARDQWIATARSREGASPFIAKAPSGLIEWVEHGAGNTASFQGW